MSSSPPSTSPVAWFLRPNGMPNYVVIGSAVLLTAIGAGFGILGAWELSSPPQPQDGSFASHGATFTPHPPTDTPTFTPTPVVTPVVAVTLDDQGATAGEYFVSVKNTGPKLGAGSFTITFGGKPPARLYALDGDPSMPSWTHGGYAVPLTAKPGVVSVVLEPAGEVTLVADAGDGLGSPPSVAATWSTEDVPTIDLPEPATMTSTPGPVRTATPTATFGEL